MEDTSNGMHDLVEKKRRGITDFSVLDCLQKYYTSAPNLTSNVKFI